MTACTHQLEALGVVVGRVHLRLLRLSRRLGLNDHWSARGRSICRDIGSHGVGCRGRSKHLVEHGGAVHKLAGAAARGWAGEGRAGAAKRATWAKPGRRTRGSLQGTHLRCGAGGGLCQPASGTVIWLDECTLAGILLLQ